MPDRTGALRDVTAFRSLDLLGGASLVVPAGTTVRVPAAGSLDFAGFNTLSVFATVAGFAAGDALKLRLNTLDPESAVGDPIGSSLGARDLITVTGNGDYAQVFNLRDFLLTPARQHLRPRADVTIGFGWDGWAGASVPFPNVYTTIDEASPNDSDYVSDYIMVAIGASCIFWLTPAVDPGVTSGFNLVTRTQRTGTTGPVTLTLSMTNAPGLTFFTRTLTDADLRGSSGFQQWSFNLSAAEVGDIVTWGTLKVGLGTAGGPAGIDGGEIRLSSWDFSMPGVGAAPGATLAVPFHRNILELVNSGATSVTLTRLLAELSRA
jgi:hypothetical protein